MAIGSIALSARFEVGQNSADFLGRAIIRQPGSAELLGRAAIRHPSSAELLGRFEAQATAELLGRAAIRHPDTAEFLGKTVIRHPGSAELLGRAAIRHPDSAELLSNFRAACSRRFGDNWQRKMWFDGTYYWRGRYCPTDDRLEFEYIAAAGFVGNVWTENDAARIDASGFTGLDADFTVRGEGNGLPSTIHYSDGVDSWVAESDEASATGWAWQNLTKVFDCTAPDYYRLVNLAANRTTPTPRLWVIAAFYDQSDGKYWVEARRQTTGGDITGWDVAVDVSNVNNTDTIYGCSVRSMGDAGLLRNDVMVIYKEGAALRSRYYDGAWQAIQDIDAAVLSGLGGFDFEHGDIAGMNMAHLLYVDADTSIQYKERDSGAAETWTVGDQLHAADASHRAVGIVEHGSNWIWMIWVHGDEVEYRVHTCNPETWYPLLAAVPLTFDVSTEAVIDTTTIAQVQTPDSVPTGEAVPICWIGETAPVTPCALGWGILIEYSIGSLYAKAEIRHPGSAELLGKAVIRHPGSAELLGRAVIRHPGSAELLGRAVIRHPGSAELLGRGIIRNVGSAELLGRAVIRHPGSAELLGKSIIRHTATLNLSAIFWTRLPRRLWTNRRYINGVIELDEKLLGDAILEYVIEGVMEDTQGYLDNAGLSYSDWTNITLVPVQILRAVTYGTVAALYARHTLTFRSQVIPSVTPVTVTVIGDAEKAMNYWEDRMNQMLEFYVTSQGGDVMLTSTPDEEPVFSMEDIPEEVTEFVSWRIWLQERGN